MRLILFLTVLPIILFIGSCSSDSAGTLDPRARITAITPSNGTLTPTFDPSITSYTLELKNRFSTLDFGITTDNNSSITVNGSDLTSSYDIPVGTNTFTITAAAPTGSATQDYTIQVTRARQFVYVTHVTDGGPDSPLALFSINPNDGQLESLTPATMAVENDPYDLLVSPNGENLYVANALSNTISQFSINPMTGALAALTPATVAQSPTPYAMTMTADSQFLYGANGDSSSPGLVSQYSTSNTGALTALSPSTVNSGNQPWFVAITPNSRYVYLTVFNSGAGGANDTIHQYSVNTNGTLTALTPSTIATQDKPWHINVDPSGSHVYITNFGSGSVGAYSINQSNGQLSLIANYAVGTSPVGLTIDPQGRYVYVANSGSNTVSMFSRNTTTGALTPIGSGTMAVSNAPYGLEVDNDGLYLYVAQSSSNTISQFSIDQTTGALTPLGTPTISSGTNPRFIRISR